MLEWAGIVISLGVSIAGWVYSIGKKDEQIDAMREKQLEQAAEMAKLTVTVALHEANDYRHFQDTELHWTSRERDELTRTLQTLQQGQMTLQNGITMLLRMAERRSVGGTRTQDEL